MRFSIRSCGTLELTYRFERLTRNSRTDISIWEPLAEHSNWHIDFRDTCGTLELTYRFERQLRNTRTDIASNDQTMNNLSEASQHTLLQFIIIFRSRAWGMKAYDAVQRCAAGIMLSWFFRSFLIKQKRTKRKFEIGFIILRID